MVVTKVLKGSTVELLETALNDWLLKYEGIYHDNNVEIVITGDSDTNGWTALIKLQKIDKTVVVKNAYDAGTRTDGFRFS